MVRLVAALAVASALFYGSFTADGVFGDGGDLLYALLAGCGNRLFFVALTVGFVAFLDGIGGVADTGECLDNQFGLQVCGIVEHFHGLGAETGLDGVNAGEGQDGLLYAGGAVFAVHLRADSVYYAVALGIAGQTEHYRQHQDK